MADETKNGQPEVKDLTQSHRIQTVAELVGAVAEEIDQIKSGVLEPKLGSLVLRGRGLQLRAVELTIQAARLDTKLRPGLGRRIGELAPIEKEVKKPEPPLRIEPE